MIRLNKVFFSSHMTTQKDQSLYHKIIVPQEYLILNDDSLLQEDIPQNIPDPLPPLQHIASQPLGDCEKSYFYALTKKGYSNNELIFIISHLLSLLTNGNTKEKDKTRIAKENQK